MAKDNTLSKITKKYAQVKENEIKEREAGLKILAYNRSFLKSNLANSIKLNIYLSIALLVCLGVIICLLIFRPSPKYFAVSSDLKVIRLVPVDTPHYNDSAILQWASKVVSESFTYDFVHWRQDVMKLQDYYTTKAFKEFVKGIKGSEESILNVVITKSYISSAVPEKAPVIVGKGVVNGKYVWKVEVPLLITYYSNSGSPVGNQKVLATILISRVPLNVDPKGIRVAQIVVR